MTFTNCIIKNSSSIIMQTKEIIKSHKFVYKAKCVEI